MHALAVRRLTWIASLVLVVAACGGTPNAPSPMRSQAPTPPSASPVSPSEAPSVRPTASTLPTGWQSVGSMVLPRLDFRSALLKDGTVLVVGNEPCVAAGEPTGSERAEIFDPVAASWSEVGALNKERAAPALVALQDGEAMVLGGSNPQSQPYSSTKIYSPAARSWSDGPLQLRAGATAALTLPDGSVLSVGTSRAEILSNGATTWRRTEAMPSTFLPDRLLLLSSGLVVAVGEREDEPGLTALMTFDPGQEKWRAIEPPDVLRAELVPLSDGSILALGDDEGGGHVQRYEPRTAKWIEPAQMATGRIRAQFTLLRDRRLLAAGGVQLISEPVEGGYSVTEGAPLASTEIYDPMADTWSPGPALLEPRQDGHAITLADDSVVVFGGYVETPPDAEGGDTGTPGPCATPLASTERLYVVP